MYAALSYHTQRVLIDLSYAGAHNELNGQGPAPVQELAVNRALVFTGPQTNQNDLNFFTLNATLHVTDTWSLQGVAYYRHYGQSVVNGNTTDYAACTTMPGILCQPDGATPLMDAAGQSLPDISNGGARYIGENDFELLDAWGRGATLQLTNSDSIFGMVNQISAGAALDYASTSFYTGAQIGIIPANLQVEPSNLIRVHAAELPRRDRQR